MVVDTDNLVSIDDVQSSFFMIETKARKKGYLVIVKDDKPRYLLLDISSEKAARKSKEHLERLQRDF